MSGIRHSGKPFLVPPDTYIIQWPHKCPAVQGESAYSRAVTSLFQAERPNTITSSISRHINNGRPGDIFFRITGIERRPER